MRQTALNCKILVKPKLSQNIKCENALYTLIVVYDSFITYNKSVYGTPTSMSVIREMCIRDLILVGKREFWKIYRDWLKSLVAQR